MKRVMLIEDSQELRVLIRHQLKSFYEILESGCCAEAEFLLQNEIPDLILLDVGLPDGNGFEFCNRLKNSVPTKDIPVIFLTAKSDPIDKMVGFTTGADDYMVKPFEPIEARARIEARLKKEEARKTSNAKEIFGPLTFDRIRQRVLLNDIDLHFTPFEFKLIYFLATHPGDFHSKADLLKHLNEPSVHVSEDNIYTHISSIRKKLGENASFVESLPRIGYRFHKP